MDTIKSVDITMISLILSQFIALMSVIASLVAVYISAKSEYRLKTTELFFTAKSKAYQDFFAIAISFDHDSGAADLKQLWANANVVFLYCSNDANEMIGQYIATVIQYQKDGSKDSKEAMVSAYTDAVLASQRDLRASIGVKESFWDKLYWHLHRKRK